MSALLAIDTPLSTCGLISIYALCDPRDGMIRYIGKAVDEKKRFRQHIQAGQLNRYKSHKNSWIKSLLSLGLKPDLQVIELCSSEFADRQERKWIEFYRDMNGDLLTNGTLGGDGGAMLPEIAKAAGLKRRGQKMTAETRARQSASHKERFASVEAREAQRQCALKAGCTPPVFRGEENNRARFTEVQVLDIRERHAAGEPRKELAAAFGTSVPQISYIVTGQIWKHVGGPVVAVKAKKKLTNTQIVEICRRVRKGESQSAVALAFGVDSSHVSRLVRGSGQKRSGGSAPPLSTGG